MKHKYIFVFCTLLLVSCGGGGGGGSNNDSVDPVSVPFSITFGLTSFSVNEDEVYEGSIVASANETVTFSYSVTSGPSNGRVNLTSGGAFSYRPSANYFGSDQFQYSVTAVEKNVTRTATVNITVNSVNDAPILTITNFVKSNEFVFPDEEILVDVDISDVDSDLSSLTFSANSLYGDPTVSLNTDKNQISINPSNIYQGGLVDVNVVLSDGESQTEKLITFWNLKKIDTSYDENLNYTFFGNGESNSRLFNYVFLIDGVDQNKDKSNIRNGIRDWLDFINDSDVKYFIDTFFNLHIIELNDEDNPIKVQTGATIKDDNDFSSLSGDELDDFYENIFEPAGCSYRDDNIYCFNGDFVSEVENFITSSGFQGTNNISVITGVEGRGTACSGCSTPINIQDYFIGLNAPEEVYVRALFLTLKHEFGHTFNDLGDEYTDDYWDPEENPGGSINCRSASDFYDDLKEFDVDEDGSFDDDELTEILRSGLNFDWGCFWVDGSPNTTSEDQPEDIKWKHLFENPDNIPGYHDEQAADGIGMFTGTYYGINDTYRPSYENVMNGSTGDGYSEWWYSANKTNGTSWDKVGIESFVIQTLKYQGLHNLNPTFSSSGASINLGLVLPNNVFDIVWYINGQIDDSLKNKTTISVDSKNSGWDHIAYRVVEKSSTKKYLFVNDEIDKFSDVYNGFFSSFDYAYYCDEPYSDQEGYEESICHVSVSGYDRQSDGSYRQYESFGFKTYDDFYNWYGDFSEQSHWAEYYIEYSGLGGQIGINWSNL
jgi:hypothetical protein